MTDRIQTTANLSWRAPLTYLTIFEPPLSPKTNDREPLKFTEQKNNLILIPTLTYINFTPSQTD